MDDPGRKHVNAAPSMGSHSDRSSDTMHAGAIANLILRLAICILAVLAITAVPFAIHVQEGRLLSLALNLFLTVVLAAAIRWGTRYAIFLSLVSALAFSLSLPPAGHFHLSDARVWTLLTACLITGVVAGQLSARARKAVRDANHRRAEALTERKRFADLVNSVEGIVWEANAESLVFSFVSEQSERILGYPAKRWLSEPAFWKEHLHPEDREWVVHLCLEAIAEKRTRDFEHRMIHADGRVVWMRDLVTVVVENGRATRLRGVMFDISGRKRAEEAARRSEEELRDVIETMPAMAWTALPDGSNAFANRQWAEYTGLSAEQTAGAGWQSTVHPEDLSGHIEKWRQSLATGQPFEHEARYRRAADGQYRWFLVRSIPLRDERGEVLKWYGIATDIEDRERAEQALRKSEERWRSVFDNSAIGVALTDLNGRFLATNHVYQTIVGYTEEELRTVNFLDVTHEDYREANRALVTELLEGKRSQFQIEKKYLRKDASSIWVSNNVSVVLGTERVPRFIMALSEDITERKRAEALLTGEKRILEMVAKGDPLPQILDNVCRFVEEQASGFLASILLVDGNRLRHGGAPSLPKAYTDAIDAVVVGPSAGSCGTAAYRGEQVIVEDIATDPLWADYREAALSHSLRACWSTPVFSSQGKVMATFALYYREPRSPSPRDQETIEQITHLAGVAIERKLTQEALRRSEAYLAEAQRLTHTGSWAYKAGGREGYWSEETFRIFQYERTTTPTVELILQRVHREDAAFVRQTIERASQDGTDFDFEHRLQMPDGSIKHLQVVGRPSKHESGSLELVGAVMDVSDRKRAEERLQRSEADLLEAQRISQTGSWKLDVLSGTVIVSPQVFRIFGVKPDEETSTPEFWLSRNHPEDQKRIRELFERSTIQKIDYDAEYRIVLPDGAIKHLHAVGHPVLNESGDLAEFVGTVMDVTEQLQTRAALEKALQEIKQRNEALRRSEATLAEAQRMTHTGSWVWNVRTDALFWSQEIFRIYGYDSEGTALATWNFLERVHPEDRPEVERRKTMESTQKDWTDSEIDFRIVLPDGTIKHLRSMAHPVMDESGEITEVLGTIIDVTERKRAEEERERLRQLEADLAHLNRVTTLGELASSLAHEINQPIAAAITSANACLRWLARNPPDLERARAAAMRIENDGSRAAEIIQRLRAFYKTGAPPQRELVDLNEVAGEMLALLHNEATRHSISLRTELVPRLPQIMADRVQLQQVLMNLMLNGMEAMTDGAGELTIRSQSTDDGLLLISVSDTGVGLPSEKVDRIFNAFYTTKPQGTGMGLAISRSIIEAHGGRLWATANAARGATFHFTLPAELRP